jgi:hypothetical protein
MVGAVLTLYDLGERTDWGRAAGLELGEHHPFAGDCGARVRVLESLGQQSDQGLVVGAALNRECALPGSREYLDRVKHLGDLVDSTQTSNPGSGQYDGVKLTGGDLPDPGVDVATDGDQLDPETEGFELGDPARRTSPTGSSPRVRPSRATITSRGSSRDGTAASAIPVAGVVGRSLSECTAMSTSPESRASRNALTNTPVVPKVATGAALASPSVTTVTSSTARPVRAVIASAIRLD